MPAIVNGVVEGSIAEELGIEKVMKFYQSIILK